MNIVELRRYTLKPGRRDDLIALFESEFIASQEECGITLLGWYRDLDDPDAFVWLRAFESMQQRERALTAFYERSQAWLGNRAAANATMIDSDNVLLLRPARPDSGFDASSIARGDSFVSVSVFMLGQPADDAYVEHFEHVMLPRLRQYAQRIAYFVTEPSPNTYPRLPVREGEWAFVASGLCADMEALRGWHEICAAPESLRLEPTGYRRLHGTRR